MWDFLSTESATGKICGVGLVMEYTILIEQSVRNFFAYAPDLPGCIAIGVTKEDVISRMQRPISLHIESLLENNESVPVPRCTATVVEVHRNIS